MHQGGCHCGKVRFEAEVNDKEGIACNCSICSKRGSLLAMTPESKFKILSGGDNLTEYLFNKHAIRHLFCKTCGILSFAIGTAPNGDKMAAINLRSLDGFELEQVQVKMVDGRKF